MLPYNGRRRVESSELLSCSYICSRTVGELVLISSERANKVLGDLTRGSWTMSCFPNNTILGCSPVEGSNRARLCSKATMHRHGSHIPATHDPLLFRGSSTHPPWAIIARFFHHLCSTYAEGWKCEQEVSVGNSLQV